MRLYRQRLIPERVVVMRDAFRITTRTIANGRYSLKLSLNKLLNSSSYKSFHSNSSQTLIYSKLSLTNLLKSSHSHNWLIKRSIPRHLECCEPRAQKLHQSLKLAVSNYTLNYSLALKPSYTSKVHGNRFNLEFPRYWTQLFSANRSLSPRRAVHKCMVSSNVKCE